VSWFDDHAQFRLKVPGFEAYCPDGMDLDWSPKKLSTQNPFVDPRIRAAIAMFPKTFSLREHDGEFRVSETASYISSRDGDTVMLYTERLGDDGVWRDFAKGTVSELKREAFEPRSKR